jgi:hypothetical protein
MALATIAVRRGSAVGAGARLGTLARARDHAGLHLGVRRDGARFGYVDPLRFFAPARPAPPPLGRAPRASPRPPRAVPAARRPVTGRPAATPTAFAPWPAWTGLGLALAGFGLRVRARRRDGPRLRGEAVAAAVRIPRRR